jgi:N-terminal domain of galactosyltransferase
VTVSVVIPVRITGDPHRGRLFDWVNKRLHAQLPDAHFVHGGDGAASGPFNRSKAVNTAVRQARGDVLVIADADVAVAGWVLRSAVGWAHQSGDRPWAIPYTDFLHLRPGQTEGLLEKAPDEVLPTVADPAKRFIATTSPLERFGGSVCGVIVIRRDNFERVGGYDERFVGWGWEDSSLAAALWTMVGPPLRLWGEALHLYHPLDPKRFQNHASRALGRRYTDAMGKPDEMAAILMEEGRCA